MALFGFVFLIKRAFYIDLIPPFKNAAIASCHKSMGIRIMHSIGHTYALYTLHITHYYILWKIT